MVNIKKHTRFRKGKVSVVKPHKRGTNLPRSSCINRVEEGTDKGNTVIIIRGVPYIYPNLENNRVGGLIKSSSAGKYYNKHIRGKYS